MMQGRLFSTGGDEIVRGLPSLFSSILTIPTPQNAACYSLNNVEVKNRLGGNDTLDQLLSTFTAGIHGELRKQSKTPVVWEEVPRILCVPARELTPLAASDGPQASAAPSARHNRHSLDIIGQRTRYC